MAWRSDGKDLRGKAEKKLSGRTEGPRRIFSGDRESLIHELQVHQVELEMQNDELRRSQGEIEEARSRYADLYDFAPVGYFTLDKKGVITEANLTGAGLLGIERGRLLKTPFSFFVIPEDRGLFQECQRKVSQIPGRHSCELRVKRKSGDPLWVGLACVAAESADGRAAGMRLTVSDIAERKRADDALKAANENLGAETAARLRLAAAVEQAGEGVAITNPEGIIDYVNPAFQRISDLWWRDVLGKNYADLGANEDLRERFRNGLARSETWSCHVVRKKGNGQSVELDVTFCPIRNGSGAVTGYLALECDVTLEVRLESHLRQMQKMEALGTLAGAIVHDLNNILSPISINTEMLFQDTPPDSPMRAPLRLVLEAAARGKNLVKQIVAFSRQKEQERQPLRMEPLVKEALRFLRPSLPARVEIRENVQAETGYILADPTQIYQVVMNLCSNGAYAMREKGGVLEVGLTEVPVDADMARRHPDLAVGPYLRLTVSDTGEGMTKEVMERAFDPFFTTKKAGEGAGIGLSLVHGIVRSGKGAITVHSEVGKGSTFNIFFPRVEAVSLSPDLSPEPAPAGR